jgi:hypothetical protein
LLQSPCRCQVFDGFTLTYLKARRLAPSIITHYLTCLQRDKLTLFSAYKRLYCFHHGNFPRPLVLPPVRHLQTVLRRAPSLKQPSEPHLLTAAFTNTRACPQRPSAPSTVVEAFDVNSSRCGPAASTSLGPLELLVSMWTMAPYLAFFAWNSCWTCLPSRQLQAVPTRC